MIVPGRIVVAVEAVNTLPGPAGLIVKFVAELTDGQKIVLASNEGWKSQSLGVANWQQPDFDDQKWSAASVVGDYGDAPWGRVAVPATAVPGRLPVGKVAEAAQDVLQRSVAARTGWTGRRAGTPADFVWPEAIVFVGDDCSLYRPPGDGGTAYDSLTVTIFNPRNSRTFPEHDLPAPDEGRAQAVRALPGAAGFPAATAAGRRAAGRSARPA